MLIMLPLIFLGGRGLACKIRISLSFTFQLNNERLKVALVLIVFQYLKSTNKFK